MTTRAVLERKMTQKRAATYRAFWGKFSSTNKAEINVDMDKDGSNEAAEYSPKFVMSSSYTSLLLSLANPQVVGTCDSLPNVVAHLHFLCHHPLVSPQRGKSVGSIDSTHPGMDLIPRSDDRTAWKAVSRKLLASMPTNVEQVLIGDVESSSGMLNEEPTRPSLLHYQGVAEAVLALCMSESFGCFADPGTKTMYAVRLDPWFPLHINW